MATKFPGCEIQIAVTHFLHKHFNAFGKGWVTLTQFIKSFRGWAIHTWMSTVQQNSWCFVQLVFLMTWYSWRNEFLTLWYVPSSEYLSITIICRLMRSRKCCLRSKLILIKPKRTSRRSMPVKMYSCEIITIHPKLYCCNLVRCGVLWVHVNTLTTWPSCPNLKWAWLET